MKKTVKQPIITQSELTKSENYQKEVIKSGYRPWVTVRASRTYGQGHIIHSARFGREHHLLSRGERLPFFFFERDLTVVDILEQFPLPIYETMEIAKQHNVVHPGAYKERKKHDNKIPAKTMTTDFLVIRKLATGEIVSQPYSFKYESALDIQQNDIRKYQRTRQKLRIEEVYWETQGKALRLITEMDFDKTEIYNLEFFREYLEYSDFTKVDKRFKSVVQLRLIKHFSESPMATLKQHLVALANELNVNAFQVLCLFQQAVYEFDFNLDLSQRIEEYRPLPSKVEVNHAN
jgi:hypothetical protein